MTICGSRVITLKLYYKFINDHIEVRGNPLTKLGQTVTYSSVINRFAVGETNEFFNKELRSEEQHV